MDKVDRIGHLVDTKKTGCGHPCGQKKSDFPKGKSLFCLRLFYYAVKVQVIVTSLPFTVPLITISVSPLVLKPFVASFKAS